VWFFSLDADNQLAVQVARRFAHLPYFAARIACEEQSGGIDYRAAREGRQPSPAEFEASYRPTGPAQLAEPGSLTEFLTARYCLFTTRANGDLLRLDIHHLPWQLQACEAEIRRTTIASAAGFDLPSHPPLLHFARRMDVLFWLPKREDEQLPLETAAVQRPLIRSIPLGSLAGLESQA
jgi:uncharacterized protein YqjF (DUF2071 family)